MSSENFITRLDDALTDLFSRWDTYSTLIATVIVFFVGYVIFYSEESDVHPFLLARQATEAPVRERGQSGIFRALDVPHGFPLKSGLGVKDPNTPKWTSGRNGDLRDIWRAAIRGALNPDGTPTDKQGKIYTVLGKRVVEHRLDDITQEINIIGQYIQESKCQTVAVCLSDSVELLATIFGG